MKFEINIFDETVTVFLQKKPPKWDKLGKVSYFGSWHFRSTESGCEFWVSATLCLKVVLDTYYHELGHVIDNVLETNVQNDDGRNNIVGWGTQLAACAWSQTFKEVFRGREIIIDYYKRKGR